MMKKIYILLMVMIPLILLAGNPNPHSVLASGKWFKISVYRAGIHKITYENFMQMGFDPATLDPTRIRIFGNGSGMLPERNGDARIDDLMENSIRVVVGDDNSFGPGDYVLFYGEPPDTWTFNSDYNRFYHTKNLYSDSLYYFVNVGTEAGKRITDKPSSDSPVTWTSLKFHDYAFHELDSLNLIKSGKTWVGELFSNVKNSYEFPFSFPNIDSLTGMKVTLHLLAKSMQNNIFKVRDNNVLDDTVIVSAGDDSHPNIFSREVKKTLTVFSPSSDYRLKITYQLPTTNSTGWLDYIEINCYRNLIWSGPQMRFRDPNTIGKCSEFRMRSTHPGIEIWDVTKRDEIHRMITVSTDSTERFRVLTDTLQEYVAFDGSSFYPVSLSGPVPNQDLHALSPAAMVIVTDPLFWSEAERLAGFHQDLGLSVTVVSLPEIYNEFGCGRKEPAAIRDFVKMLYDKSGGAEPRYLLLMGDGTYDPKNRLPGNNDFIPAFQSVEYLNSNTTFVTDDFYGLMSYGEGYESNGTLDMGIGRFPVSTEAEAKIMVDKVIHYCSAEDSVFGDWRNRITFIADDENQNLHFNQAETLSKIVKRRYPVFNVKKIYNDAYKMVQTPAGYRLPQVNDEISRTIAEGTLLINYTGHGGEDGFAAEKILTLQDIGSWTNKHRLPVFITATCEFSRFDNPERFTAGEMIITRADGGAIALFSTSRLSFASTNFNLDSSFFNHLLSTDGSPDPRMGDLIRYSKNDNDNNAYVKNFILFGDPALQISYPRHNVVTTSINTHLVDAVPDTALGLSMVNIRGQVQDDAGKKVLYNGIITPTVYDKAVTTYTLGNFPPESYSAPYKVQNSLIFRGKTNVVNGEFEFCFVVPKGINPSFGLGKISYYIKNNEEDGWGFDTTLVIGGEDPTVNPVNIGPEITMYMDTVTFVSGGKTNPNTMLFATLDDPDGINYIGLGIGHDILCTLDNATKPILLNDYFNYETGSCNRGRLSHFFTDLSPGKHTLRLKAWDMYNNASTKEIIFYVRSQDDINMTEVSNHPNPFNPFIKPTTFSVSTSNTSGKTSLRIDIFDYKGQIVTKIEKDYQEGMPRHVEIVWDGTGNNGARLSAGLYIYSVSILSADGAFSRTSQKLIITD